MDVDTLDAAARLAGIEEGAVDDVFDGVAELGVGADVGRVLAAELEAGTDEARRRGLLHRVTTGYGAGEGDEVDAFAGDQLGGRVMAQVQVPEQAFGQASGPERLGEAFGAEWGLVRVLEQHPIAGQRIDASLADLGRRTFEISGENLALPNGLVLTDLEPNKVRISVR